MSIGYYQLPNGRVAAIDNDCDFPLLHEALTEPNGLLAIGGDLSVAQLLKAYQRGIFPWFSAGEPVLWWSPNPRMVLKPSELKISRSLAKTLKNTAFTVRFNTAFREVITACSQTQRVLANGELAGTWITDTIIEGYCAMFAAGYGISAETLENDVLVGGCYGIKIGNMFYGESMFHHKTDASKIAFVHLVQKLQLDGVQLIDCQMKTPHLASFGAREIERDEFIKTLSELIVS